MSTEVPEFREPQPFKASINDAEKFERPGFDGFIQVSAEQHLGFTALTILVHGEHPRKRIVEGTRTYYVTEGTGVFTLNDEEQEVAQGDLIVIPPAGEYSYHGEMSLFEMNIPDGLSVTGSVIDEKLDQ